ncbi:MAG: DUF1295 domain-containing protein [Anaerolineae bacterium]
MLEVAVLIALYFVVFFVVGTILRNNSIVDIGWGLGFVVVAAYVLLATDGPSVPLVLIALLVAIWGLRLSYHIMRRNLGKPEDFRYANWRTAWGKWVIPRAFFQVYMLQGLFMFLVSLPITLTGLASAAGVLSMPLLVAGAAIWIVGFIFEAVGDYQLKRFLAQPENRGQLMTSGLWSLTRHPNYFGEAVMWWGIFVLAVSGGASLLAVISPILITYLLRYVSGVPLLEKSMSRKPGFEKYARRTSVFVPWRPKN